MSCVVNMGRRKSGEQFGGCFKRRAAAAATNKARSQNYLDNIRKKPIGFRAPGNQTPRNMEARKITYGFVENTQ
jgi:hypothetical protein